MLTGSSSIARERTCTRTSHSAGSVMNDVLFHLDQGLPATAFQGDNDTAYGIPKDAILWWLQRRQHRIYVMAVKPQPNVWDARFIRNYQSPFFVDSAFQGWQSDDDIFVEDGLHLNASR